MNSVVLEFPDLKGITEFVISHQPSNVEVVSAQKLVRGVLSDDLVHLAVMRYRAEIK